MSLLPHGPHAAFVVAAYGISGAGLAILAAASLWRSARWRRRAERAGR